MFIAFAADACNQHSMLALVAMVALLPGCAPAPVVATLEARPSGKYDEEISWTAQVPPGTGKHAVAVEIEIDGAQLMGWAKTTYAMSMMVDVGWLQGDTLEQELWKTFPVTEEKRLGEEDGVVKIAFLAAGEPLPSGFRKPPSQKALSFSPDPGEATLRVRLRTPNGADRRSLKAVRTVRLLVRSRSDAALTQWVEQERAVRK